MPPGAPMRDLSAQRQRSQLPSEVTGFIGRKAELARISALLDSSRLVTVLGPGGVGKTRLALRTAAHAKDRYPDGTCLVDLSGLADADPQAPGRLAAAVASCLGLPEAEARAQQDAVLRYLQDQRLLLILDTCEHVIDACAVFAEHVLRAAPWVTMLATSRQPLDILGEHTFLLPPLPVPADNETTGGDAVDLFAQRAAAAVPGFRVTAANRTDVVRLCQRLDGIPLAIELAAIRLRALPLPDLTRRLENRFQVLTSGRRGAVARHQTLHTAIEWSYELCSPAEQELWARLSAFADGFEMDAVHEVCADPGAAREETITTLVSLVDKSIVLREPAYGVRYRMLDTLREFGVEKLAASGHDAQVRDRLLARCLRMARRFDARFLGDDQLAMFHELRGEHANIRAALTFSLDCHPLQRDRERDGAALATALHMYWVISGCLAEGGRWLGMALDRFSGPSPLRARALAIRGRLAAVGGDIPAALADIRASLQLATELGDRMLIACCHMYLNLTLAFAGRYEEASQAGAEAVRLMEADGDHAGLLCIQPQLAHLYQLAGDPDRSVEQCAAGLRMAGAHSAEGWLHSSLHLVAGLALFQQPGRQAESATEVRRALQAKHELGDLAGTAYALEALAWLAAREGRPERAAWLMGAADPLWKRAGSRLSSTAVLEEHHRAAEHAAQEALGEERYATLAAAGARRPLAIVIGQALADGDELRGHEPAGGPVTGTSATGNGLTSREHEIAVLVASGLSNRDIAGRLVISKRTVDAHVEHIFSKLGISSRVQLTVWLRERLAGGQAARAPAPAPPPAR
jgi:predicted ATPase/DNA-binding CsgD family transcriptional regulator